MICAIHQPNFVPWYPFFQKLMAADVFVLLTNCQFEKNNYQNRFLFRDDWYTLRVRRGTAPIAEKRYVDPLADWEGIKARLPEHREPLSAFDPCIGESLALTNVGIIRAAAEMLGARTRIVLDHPTPLTKTDRLVDLCMHHGADTYLSGVTGREYLELEKFERAGVKVVFQDQAGMDRRHVFEVLTERMRHATCV